MSSHSAAVASAAVAAAECTGTDSYWAAPDSELSVMAVVAAAIEYWAAAVRTPASVALPVLAPESPISMGYALPAVAD